MEYSDPQSRPSSTCRSRPTHALRRTRETPLNCGLQRTSTSLRSALAAEAVIRWADEIGQSAFVMLTQRHLESLACDGYAVVSSLVPDHLVKAARDRVCSYVGADLDRPETWYHHEPLDWSIVPVHHAQEFWDVRQWPPVHEAFALLWGTENLWVSMDRAVFKVPQSVAHPQYIDESVLHWDVDPRTPDANGYQAMLFLTDAGPGEGTFECAPSIFRDIDQYLNSHPGPVLNVPVDLAAHHLIELTVQAGDLVIWSARLPHQGGPNGGARPRVSLAVTMHPRASDSDRQARVDCWRQKRAPSWWRGWKGQTDPEAGDPATLTALGRRLVGLDPWP